MATNVILTDQDYESVRQAIDTTLDDVSLPDDTIALSIFQGRAELECMEQDPAWNTRTGAALQHLRNAAILFTAAYIVTSLSRNDSEVFGQRYQFKRTLLSASVLASSLQAQAQSEMDAILLTADVVAERPTFFALGDRWCR